MLKLIHVFWQHFTAGVHGVTGGEFNYVDAKHAACTDIGHAVFCVTTVGLIAGGRKHHLRGRVRDRVEKRIRREVV